MRTARYAGCALAAAMANLSAQAAILAADPSGRRVAVALVVGTAVGLLVKYVLDTVLVFSDRFGAPAAEARRFGLYTATGLVTTALFWAVELAVHAATGSAAATAAGGAVGLALGYALKYALDRRFVFVEAAR
jgi:putative flippase GtrA